MAKLIAVRFQRKSAPYNAGDVAGFIAPVAQRFVLAGAARYVEAPQGLDLFGKPRLTAPVHKARGVYVVGDKEVKGKANAWAEWSRITGLPIPGDEEDDD